MRKHSENNSHQFMGSGKDSLSVGQTILAAHKEIFSEYLVHPDNAQGHEVDDTPEVPVAPLGNPAGAFELTGLIDRGVEPGKDDQGLGGREVVDGSDLRQEGCSRSVPDAIDRGDNLHLLDHHGLAHFSKHIGDVVHLLHQMQQGADLLRKDKLSCGTERGYGTFRRCNDVLGADGNPSVPAGAFQGTGNGTDARCLDETCRGVFFEEKKHGSGKDVRHAFQFRKRGLHKSLDLVFGGCDEMGKGLPLTSKFPEIFDRLREGELLDRVFVDKQEPGDREGVFLVGLGLPQRELGEVEDQKRVQNNSGDLSVAEEGKKIDMVAAGGFHGGHNSGEVPSAGPDGFQQGGKAALVHRDTEGESHFPFCIEPGGGECVLGYIDTDKQRVQRVTSLQEYSLCRAGEASRPILHGDKDSVTQSTYHGFGRQGTGSSKGSMAQVKWSSPAFPAPMCNAHSYKRYTIFSL